MRHQQTAHGARFKSMSHRGKDFVGIAEKAEVILRELLVMPLSYRVLLLQSGANGQFAAIPFILQRDKAKFANLNTGLWSEQLSLKQSAMVRFRSWQVQKSRVVPLSHPDQVGTLFLIRLFCITQQTKRLVGPSFKAY